MQNYSDSEEDNDFDQMSSGQLNENKFHIPTDSEGEDSGSDVEEISYKKQNKQQKYQQDSDNDQEDDQNEDDFEEDQEEENDDEDDDEEEEEAEEDYEKQLEQEEEEIQQQLKSLPFEMLLKLKKQSNKDERNKLLKNFGKQKDQTNKSMNKLSIEERRKAQKQAFKKKANKDAPVERDARVQVSRFQQVLTPKRQKARDPRFDNLSGQLDLNAFNKSFNFLDERKKNEKQLLEQELKKKKYSKDQKSALKRQLGEIKSQLIQKDNIMLKQSVKSKFKKQAIQQLQKGQKPHFAKKSELKNAELKVKYDKLEAEGKLDKLLTQKRKKHSDKLKYGLDRIIKKTHI